MKKIRLVKENEEKILEAINETEGNRVTARTITVEDVFDKLKEVQNKLDTLLCRKDQKGLRVSVDYHAQKFPASYKYRPESTQFAIEKSAKDWFIVSISRDYCGNSSNKEIEIKFSDEQKVKIAEFVSQYKNW